MPFRVSVTQDVLQYHQFVVKQLKRDLSGPRGHMAVGKSQRPYSRWETKTPCSQSLSEEFIERRVKRK